LLESEEKIRDLQKENSILRESNNKLLDSAYSVEAERQYHASENALKVSQTLLFSFMDRTQSHVAAGRSERLGLCNRPLTTSPKLKTLLFHCQSDSLIHLKINSFPSSEAGTSIDF
jgi:hypothetical protein